MTTTDRIEIQCGYHRHHSERSREEVVQALTADRPGEWKVIDWHDSGNHIWTVREIELNGLPHRIILCTCIEEYPRHITWRTIPETGGIFYTDCPLRFLQLAPVPDCHYVRGWRQKVINRKGGTR